MVSLLLRPLVCPAVPKVTPEKRMEVRFFAPGGLVSNLDFVESIFGNAGDPYLPENDAGSTWTAGPAHSGCVILAPHLVRLRKKDLGLPHVARPRPTPARERHVLGGRGRALQRRPALQDHLPRGIEGVMVTLIADNYFGYCKKEVKTQISYAANLFGLAEEEHAGGALAFPTLQPGRPVPARAGAGRERGPPLRRGARPAGRQRSTSTRGGYAIDTLCPEIHYMPEDMRDRPPPPGHDVEDQGRRAALKLLPGHIYIHPSGYKVRMEKHRAAPSWRLVGTVARGRVLPQALHRVGRRQARDQQEPGGRRAAGPFFVRSFDEDMELVEEIFGGLTATPGSPASAAPARPLLSPERSLGSVIKLLTPIAPTSPPSTTPGWRRIPNHIRAAGVHHQALLPPGVGRRLAQATSA